MSIGTFIKNFGETVITTIAYKDDVIAYESRATIDGCIDSDTVNKMTLHQGVRFFLAGRVDEKQALIAAYFNKGGASECSTGGFAVEDGQVFYIGMNKHDGFFKVSSSNSSAFGSGCEYAIGAMDAGATAKEAVKVAIGRDIYSGGRIRVYKIDK